MRDGRVCDASSSSRRLEGPYGIYLGAIADGIEDAPLWVGQQEPGDCLCL